MPGSVLPVGGALCPSLGLVSCHLGASVLPLSPLCSSILVLTTLAYHCAMMGLFTTSVSSMRPMSIGPGALLVTTVSPASPPQGSCTQLVPNKCTVIWDSSNATLQKSLGCLSSTYPPPFSPILKTPPPTRGAGHDLVHAMGLHGRHNVPGALGHNCGRTLEGTESGCH